MRAILVLVFSMIYLFGDVYYAKLEPIESYAIKSSVSGRVIFSDLNKEGKFVKDTVIIKIDDKLDKDDLKTSLKKLDNLKKLEILNKQNIKSLKKTYEIKKRNYDRIKNLKTKSKVEKDTQLINVISALTSLTNAKQSLINLQNSIGDLRYKIATLKDRIDKKNVIVKDRYIYSIAVKEGDYVGTGTLLLQEMDISKAKATIYLSYEDKANIDKRVIYINGKKSDLRFSKVWDVADSVNISSYKAELILPRPKQFSQVIKIELK